MSTLTGYLPLRFLLTGTAVLLKDFSPLHHETESSISGRTQRGMLAAALGKLGYGHLIDDWIASGKYIRFAPALPRTEDSDRPATVAVPTPAALHRVKSDGRDEHTFLDVLAAPDESELGKRIGGFITPDLEQPVTVATRVEQYLAASRDGATPLQGVPFLNTMLDAGQVFEARWQLRADSTDELADLADRILGVLHEAADILVIGTGATRAHGGGLRITPVNGRELPLAQSRLDTHRPDWGEGEERDLVLLAPALVTDATGEPRPEALPRRVLELAHRVLGADTVELTGDLVDPQRVEAYHTRYHSAMAARWTAAAGSVVRLRAHRPIPAEQVRHLEAETVGLRAADGFGCFVVLPLRPDSGKGPGGEVPDGLDCRPVATSTVHTDAPVLPAGVDPEQLCPVTLADGETARVSSQWPDAVLTGGDTSPHPEVRELFDRLLWAAIAEPVRAQARSLVARTGPADLPTPSLLGRLREVATHNPAEPAAETLTTLARVVGGDDAEPPSPHKKFSPPAQHAVAAAKVTHKGGSVPLRDWLVRAAASDTAAQWWQRYGPDATWEIAQVDLARDTDSSRPSDAAQAWLDDPANRARLARLLIVTWLAEAARRARDDDTTGSTGQPGEERP
ncbi:hypothetical protein [Salinactinospora qingdaonensis]|uniref:CRISPR-associated protein Csx17 n=1 Tax=Salinactinospora qingdaonensis TaxID=702744 RepID=A0ABP7FT10_9ACTN